MKLKQKDLVKINWLLAALAVLLAIIAVASLWPRAKPEPVFPEDRVEQIKNFKPEVEEIVTPPGEIPLRWFTYKDEERGLSFRYPPEWTTPEKRLIGGEVTDTDTGSPFDFIELNMIFEPLEKEGLRVTRIARLDEIAAASVQEDAAVAYLKKTYDTQAVPASAPPVIPTRQDTLEAYSAPTYVESQDGSVRGIAFFANFITVQPQGAQKRLPYLVIELTDGEYAIQFSHWMGQREGAFLGTYQDSRECSNASGAALPGKSCLVSNELQTELDEVYLLVLKSLTSQVNAKE